MTDYNKLASANIRSYLWQKIQDSGLLDINDYYADGFDEALVPIIPVQQVPEFNNLLPGKSYIIYDFEVKTIPVQWWMSDEMMTLAVFSQNYELINKITNLVQDLFRRYDESAKDVNTYLAGDTEFQFHHILIDNIFSPEPYSSEGDFQTGQIALSYSYSRKTDGNGRF